MVYFAVCLLIFKFLSVEMNTHESCTKGKHLLQFISLYVCVCMCLCVCMYLFAPPAAATMGPWRKLQIHSHTHTHSHTHDLTYVSNIKYIYVCVCALEKCLYSKSKEPKCKNVKTTNSSFHCWFINNAPFCPENEINNNTKIIIKIITIITLPKKQERKM